MTRAPGDQYAHLRANAAAQKQITVDRLSQAITQLEAEGREVSTFAIKEVSGMDYMAYYRNRDAFQLFQEHSTHLRKKREKEQAKQKTASRGRSQQSRNGQSVAHVVPTSPMLDSKQLRLVELLHEARDERDEARRQLRTKRAEIEQRAKAEQADLMQRYDKLLQEHMQCGVKMARLEAELAQFKSFMERYRCSLQREEQES